MATKKTSGTKASVGSSPDNRQLWLLNVIRSTGLTKRAFARSIPIDVVSLTSMSNGKREITDYTVSRIVAKLGVMPPSGTMVPMEVTKKEDVKALQSQLLRLAMQVQTLQDQLHRKEEEEVKKSSQIRRKKNTNMQRK